MSKYRHPKASNLDVSRRQFIAAATAGMSVGAFSASSAAFSKPLKSACDSHPSPRSESMSISEFRELFSFGPVDLTNAGFPVDVETMRYWNINQRQFFPSVSIERRDGSVLPLLTPSKSQCDAIASLVFETSLGEMTLDEYVHTKGSNVDGIIVLKENQVLYEAYPRMRPSDLHTLYSVTKIFGSLGVALLQSDGLVDIDRPLGRYLRALKDSDWGDIPVRNVMNMMSGMDVSEMESHTDNPYMYRWYHGTYGLDPTEPIENPLDVMKSAKKKNNYVDAVWDYSSMNTAVLAWLVEDVSGLPIHEFLADRVWSRIGAESDAELTLSPYGTPGMDGGVTCTLRDLARLGLAYTDWSSSSLSNEIRNHIDDVVKGVPAAQLGAGWASWTESWRDFINADRLPSATGPQWDYVWPEVAAYKGGYSGQGLYFEPRTNIVVAFFGSTSTSADGASINESDLDERCIFARIADAVKQL